MTDQILLVDDIAASRRALVQFKWRRLVLLLVVHGFFGLIAGVLVYYMPSAQNAGLAVFLGATCAALSGVPAIIYWLRRCKGMLRELSEIEADVLSGKLIYNNKLEIMARNAAA
jgi:uncharacterized membrane protein HdeD (DUF308 family)